MAINKRQIRRIITVVALVYSLALMSLDDVWQQPIPALKRFLTGIGILAALFGALSLSRKLSGYFGWVDLEKFEQ